MLGQVEDHEVDEERSPANPEAGRTWRLAGRHGGHGVCIIRRMISVREGQNRILAQIDRNPAPEILPLSAALGRVLVENARAPCAGPPTATPAVAGYAAVAADIPARGLRELTVVADLPAGAVFVGALAAGQAVRIMTGAPIPAGADTVYLQEQVERSGPRVRIGPIERSTNVRRRGEDVMAGTVVIPGGSVLRPQELGLLASLGHTQVLVSQRPRVALLSTGDEVAEPGTPRKPGQIYDANRFTLRGFVEQCGGSVTDFGIVPDQREVLRAQLLEASRIADVVMTSGGVSVGIYDLVKAVLGEIGGIDVLQGAKKPGRALAVRPVGGADLLGPPRQPLGPSFGFLLFGLPPPFN